MVINVCQTRFFPCSAANILTSLPMKEIRMLELSGEGFCSVIFPKIKKHVVTHNDMMSDLGVKEDS